MKRRENVTRRRGGSLAMVAPTATLVAGMSLALFAATAEPAAPAGRSPYVWHSEIVAGANVLGDLSLALDSANNPHITYCTPDRIHLKHAYLSGASWHGETLERWVGQDMLPPEHCGLRNDIAIDSQDRIHVSFTKYQDPEWSVRYAWYDDGMWRIDTVHLLTINDFTSIAIDSNGYPHITYALYQHPVGFCLIHGWTDFSWKLPWYEEGLDLPVSFNCIAIDSFDFPHIAYNYDRFERCDLRYTFYDGDTWTTVEVDTTDETGSHVSLALDGNDLPHISYRSEGPGGVYLKYARNDGLTWQIEAPDTTSASGTSIVLDSADLPHISYLASGGVKYAHFDGLDWSIEFVDSTSYAGMRTSIALDENEFPHIAYGRGGNVCYACAAPLVTLSINASEGGTTEPVPGDYPRAEGSSIEVTARPDPCYSFDYWEIDGFDAGSDNPYEVLMDEDHTLEAFFALCDCDVAPEIVEFDSVGIGDSAESTFVLRNCGETNLTGTVTESSEHFRLDPEVVYYDVPPGETLEVFVYFEPQAAGYLSCQIETGNDFCDDVFCDGIGIQVSHVNDPDRDDLSFAFRLEQNRPNPFNPLTEIVYAIPPGRSSSGVTLRVYNPLGRLVRTLVDGSCGAGIYTTAWDGKDEAGKAVASGVYFYRLTWNGRSETKRMVLLK